MNSATKAEFRCSETFDWLGELLNVMKLTELKSYGINSFLPLEEEEKSKEKNHLEKSFKERSAVVVQMLVHFKEVS